jgi:hypothetical protein
MRFALALPEIARPCKKLNHPTMTTVANTGKRGLSAAAATYLNAKGTWTWFGVVKFTSRQPKIPS